MLSQRQEFLLISAAISFSVERCEPLRFGRTRTAQIGWRIVWSDFTTSKPSQDKGTCRRDNTEDWLISLGFTGNRILNSEDPTFGEKTRPSRCFRELRQFALRPIDLRQVAVRRCRPVVAIAGAAHVSSGHLIAGIGQKRPLCPLRLVGVFIRTRIILCSDRSCSTCRARDFS